MQSIENCFAGRSDLASFEALTEQYRTSGIGLFLGLGVSCRSGLPDWETLTERVMRSIDGGARTFEQLKATGYSLPAILSWARVRSPADFNSRLRSALYAELDVAFRSGLAGNALRDTIRKSNPTLAAVAAFTVQKRNESVLPNPQVRAILTTNADTLLRYYSRKVFHTSCLRTIERAAAGPLPGRTNVYHLHGMLRFDDKLTLDKEAPDKLVFTDLEYYTAYRELASIFTYTSLFLFRELPFLFIGTRLTDDNVRRLLYWSQSEIARSYEEEHKEMPSKKRLRHFALLMTADTNEAVESLLQPLGVCPIWYRGHDCLPAILRRLYGDDSGWNEFYGDEEALCDAPGLLK